MHADKADFIFPPTVSVAARRGRPVFAPVGCWRLKS